MSDQFRPAVIMLALFMLITGAAYPLAVTGIAQALFPHQANGSLVREGGQAIGSELIGQPFNDPRYFWGRPSATEPYPYNARASSGSNLGPGNPALRDSVRSRVAALRDADPGNTQPVPVDLVTASGSGLDPHVSVAAALYQVSRVARARGLSENQVELLVRQSVEERQFGVLGEARINLLNLNLVLDRVQ